jgi:hypothetical protein
VDLLRLPSLICILDVLEDKQRKMAEEVGSGQSLTAAW